MIFSWYGKERSIETIPHRERITPLTAIALHGSRSLDCLEEVVLKLDSSKGSYHPEGEYVKGA